jgi:hypothetical protein
VGEDEDRLIAAEDQLFQELQLETVVVLVLQMVLKMEQADPRAGYQLGPLQALEEVLARSDLTQVDQGRSLLPEALRHLVNMGGDEEEVLSRIRCCRQELHRLRHRQAEQEEPPGHEERHPEDRAAQKEETDRPEQPHALERDRRDHRAEAQWSAFKLDLPAYIATPVPGSMPGAVGVLDQVTDPDEVIGVERQDCLQEGRQQAERGPRVLLLLARRLHESRVRQGPGDGGREEEALVHVPTLLQALRNGFLHLLPIQRVGLMVEESRIRPLQPRLPLLAA